MDCAWVRKRNITRFDIGYQDVTWHATRCSWTWLSLNNDSCASVRLSYCMSYLSHSPARKNNRSSVMCFPVLSLSFFCPLCGLMFCFSCIHHLWLVLGCSFPRTTILRVPPEGVRREDDRHHSQGGLQIRPILDRLMHYDAFAAYHGVPCLVSHVVQCVWCIPSFCTRILLQLWALANMQWCTGMHADHVMGF